MLNLNTPQKLSAKVLYYKLIIVLPVLTLLWIGITRWGSVSSQLSFLKSAPYLIPIVLVILLTLAWLYLYLWWKIFTYTISENHIELTSGILIRHSKVVNFNDLQSVNVVFGPILAIFGLRKIQGFTSSPQQLVVTGDNNSINTRHVPDILLIVEKELAEEIVRTARAGDVQKVQNVQ